MTTTVGNGGSEVDEEGADDGFEGRSSSSWDGGGTSSMKCTIKSGEALPGRARLCNIRGLRLGAIASTDS